MECGVLPFLVVILCLGCVCLNWLVSMCGVEMERSAWASGLAAREGSRVPGSKDNHKFVCAGDVLVGGCCGCAVRGVGHHLVGRRGGVGGERGGERGALHDPVVLTIVVEQEGGGVGAMGWPLRGQGVRDGQACGEGNGPGGCVVPSPRQGVEWRRGGARAPPWVNQI
eukprot:scaffold96305_cov44-Tisochrysis_lutea.AAC.2